MARLILKVQKPVFEVLIESKDSAGNRQSFIAGFNRYKTEESKVKTEEYQEIVDASAFQSGDNSELDAFIKREIQYLKKVSLELTDEETGKDKNLNIPDTRTAKKLEALWDTPEECLDVLLDSYFEWSSWRVSFIAAVQSALLDMDIEEAKLKNY